MSRPAARAIFWLGVGALAVACSRSGRSAPDPELARAVSEATLVFVGRVVNVGPPPAFESGRGIAFQEVEYEIREVLKGAVPEGTERVSVRHLVKPKDPFSAEFVVGRELLVLARERNEVLWAAGSRLGAMPASEENLAEIRAALGSLAP